MRRAAGGCSGRSACPTRCRTPSTSLKVAASLSVIAAIVAEYFGGEQGTLGGIITQSAGLSRYDRAWAAVIAAALLG